MSALITYTEYAFAVVFALLATGFALFIACCVGMMFYALYKGATDETWR